jgi:hypothetical protein
MSIITKPILSLTCSDSLCERNLSIYSFVHSKIWNRLEVEKVGALVYTNSRLLRQRPGVDPICYYDDNIFSEDSNDDGGVLFDSNNNNSNGCNGHDGNDRNASDRDEEHPREFPLINPKNVHQENPFNWNKIDDKIANGVDEHAVLGSIGNMHVNEGKYFDFGKHGYD